MKIQKSQVEMAASHLATERHEIQESFRFWAGDPAGQVSQGSPGFRTQDRVTLSPSSRKAEKACCREGEQAGGDPKTEIIRLLLEKLTGRKIRIITLSDLEPVNSRGEIDEGEQKQPPEVDSPSGFGLAYDRYETYSESETLQFAAGGVLLTEDGREIRFRLQFEMNRSFEAVEHTAIRLGDARMMDPLVVNLEDQSAVLTDATFFFDIDSDGVDERLAALGPGKGFLALDKNNDGRITDGSELFGPSLGDGFLELAGLDKDGNGWVDEADPGFADLGVWQKNSLGNESFLTLEASGIGAIYGGKISTPFSLKSAANDLQGEVKETGLYLKEDGSAAVIQELDLVV